jgi:hypothetical protein
MDINARLLVVFIKNRRQVNHPIGLQMLKKHSFEKSKLMANIIMRFTLS